LASGSQSLLIGEKNGIWGTGVLGQWPNRLDDKSKKGSYPLPNPMFHHSTIALFSLRETFFYFTGAIIEVSSQTSKNKLYFH